MQIVLHDTQIEHIEATGDDEGKKKRSSWTITNANICIICAVINIINY